MSEQTLSMLTKTDSFSLRLDVGLNIKICTADYLLILVNVGGITQDLLNRRT